MKITQQGEVELYNTLYHGLIEHDEVVVFSIETKNKACQIGAYISDEENTAGLLLQVNGESAPTIVMFPSYKGKRIHRASSDRYTVNVTLVKDTHKYGTTNN